MVGIPKNLATKRDVMNLQDMAKKNLIDRKKWITRLEELQIEIFNYRKQAYLIPNWFYKLSRSSKQKEEDYFAKSLSKTK